VRALVLADGDGPRRSGLDATWPGWDMDVGLVVAADGGARLADALGLPLDLWVGDGDSLGSSGIAALEARGVPLQRAAPDKDESDAELAVRAALAHGATDLTILGALGGRRLDHALANIGLLAHPALAGGRARLLDEHIRVTLIDAPGPDGRPIHAGLVGRIGDLVSLLPWGARVEGVTTNGLRYPLRDEPLDAGPARGLSNVRERAEASVAVRSGRLLVVESAASLDG
jgi:thiamine pyrophosphokinase